MKQKCLNPECERRADCRGLCKSCYLTARLLVRKGKVTWEQLEAAGRSAPAKPPPGPSKASQWLLAAVPPVSPEGMEHGPAAL